MQIFIKNGENHMIGSGSDAFFFYRWNRNMSRRRNSAAKPPEPHWYHGADIPMAMIRRFARQVAETLQLDSPFQGFLPLSQQPH